MTTITETFLAYPIGQIWAVDEKTAWTANNVYIAFRMGLSSLKPPNNAFTKGVGNFLGGARQPKSVLRKVLNQESCKHTLYTVTIKAQQVRQRLLLC